MAILIPKNSADMAMAEILITGDSRSNYQVTKDNHRILIRQIKPIGNRGVLEIDNDALKEVGVEVIVMEKSDIPISKDTQHQLYLKNKNLLKDMSFVNKTEGEMVVIGEECKLEGTIYLENTHLNIDPKGIRLHINTKPEEITGEWEKLSKYLKKCKHLYTKGICGIYVDIKGFMSSFEYALSNPQNQKTINRYFKNSSLSNLPLMEYDYDTKKWFQVNINIKDFSKSFITYDR